MPVVIPASPGATSTAQTLPALQVFDYLYLAGDPTSTTAKPVPNAEIRITLQHDRATTQSPIVYVAPRTIVTSTDRNGYWSAYLVANDALSPLNTVYTVQTPHSVYQISVPSGGGPYKSSTVLANAVSNLPPATTNVIGPLTVTGNETVTGNLTVGGNTSLGATTVGALTAAAGIFSGDLTIASAFRLLFGAAVAKIIGGATSLSLRNNADTQDNVLVTDAGAVTVRNGLTVSAGAIALPAASVADAALSSNVPLKNAANTFSAQQTISNGGAAITGATSVTGNLTHTTAYKAMAYATANTALTAGTPTKVTLATKAYDPNTNFDTVNSRYTAPVTGYYEIVGVVSDNGVEAASVRNSYVILSKNSRASELARSGANSVASSGFWWLTATAIALLTAGDTVELYAYSTVADTAKGNATLDPSTGQAWLAIHYLSS